MEFWLKNLRLAMWDATELPEREWSEEKQDWVKTGKKVENTNYIFRDEFGTKITLMSKEPKWRDFESKDCDVQIRVNQKTYKGVMKTSLQLLAVSLAE